MNERHQRIDSMAEQAHTEIARDGLRARCEIAGMVSHHIRSIAQLRRYWVAERLNKQQLKTK